MSEDKTAIRLVCPKFSGNKGKEFTAWKRPYLDGCYLKGDDDASYTECYLGTDPQAGLSAAQLRRRAVRRRESAYFLIMHIEDESLKEVLREVRARRHGHARPGARSTLTAHPNRHACTADSRLQRHLRCAS